MLRKDRVIDGEQRWHVIGVVRKAALLVVHAYLEENPNDEKQSESSRPAKPIRTSAESIWSKPLTKSQTATLTGVARRQARGDATQIDYSDIPALTERQMAQFKRAPKKLIAVRLDADVFEWIQKFGAGYSTRINSVLRVVMSQQREVSCLDSRAPTRRAATASRRCVEPRQSDGGREPPTTRTALPRARSRHQRRTP